MNTQTVSFNGSNYIPQRDDIRLRGQIKRVWDVMKTGEWLTLTEIAKATSDPEASISAQLRHLRKHRFGAHTIDKLYLGMGLYAYKLIVNPASTIVEDLVN